MNFIAAMPMYDPPQEHDLTDALWCSLRKVLRKRGIAAPERLVRVNADMPAIAGGIKNSSGTVIAPDPATLPPDELDLHTLWRHPGLLLGETCWGPLEHGLKPFVHVIGQNNYEGLAGGSGILYRSAIIGRHQCNILSPEPSDMPVLPEFTNKRFAFNSRDSRSGYLSLERDLQTQGESMQVFSRLVQTGSHLASLHAIAAGQADVAAVDCKSWALAQKHHPALSGQLKVIGWTAPSAGLPFICSAQIPDEVRRQVQDVAQAFFLPPARC